MDYQELDPSQRLAVDGAFDARLSVITGGAGTGKSTTVRAILDRATERGDRFHLCAPSGKAARRLGETTGEPAKTIHSLIGLIPGRRRARYSEEDPLAGDLFVVDEASMMDGETAARLFEAIPEYARVLLVGDVEQLPPVGGGQPMYDVIKSGRFPVHRLEVIHRQAGDSWVVDNTPAIIGGRMPSLAPTHDFRFSDCEEAALIVDRALGIVMACDSDPVILAPMNRIVRRMNIAMQELRNPRGRAVAKEHAIEGAPAIEMRVGDPILFTSNDYDRGVFNGDGGRILGVGGAGVEAAADGRTDTILFSKAELPRAAAVAYSTTIHKSQGSEWPHVIAIVHSTAYRMLGRSLFYTGVTRCSERLDLIGDAKGIAAAVKKDTSGERMTRLAEKIEKEIEDAKTP